MSWFFTADTHFSHGNIIKYCKRPFLDFVDQGICDLISLGTIPAREFVVSEQTVAEMDSCIIDSINSLVDKHDNLVIVGDFCFAKGRSKVEKARSYRERINCQNVYLILGNHDNRDVLKPLFNAIYENYLFQIDGQQIFASHYPARSWNRAAYGSWMVYGHVHNSLHSEDNGELSRYKKKIYGEGFAKVLREKLDLQVDDALINALLEVCASTNGVDLTVDVGVDNHRAGTTFGTPWSMDDLRKYMSQKRVLWGIRNKIFQELKRC